MRVDRSLLKDMADHFEYDAARMEDLLSGLVKVTGNLGSETPLAAVRVELLRLQRKLETQAAVFRRMAAVLAQTAIRYGQSDTHITQRYDEAYPALMAVGYKTYDVPELYLEVLQGL